MKKIKILLSGRLDLGPLGRHMLSFIETLSQSPRYQIHIDQHYTDLFKCDSLSTTKLLEHYTSQNNIFIANDKDDYDFGIYTDLLTLNYDDNLYQEFLRKNCTIRICYEVFDGSIPPLDWIDIINDNFDICLSPSIYISQSLSSAGIKVPCFNLPCTVFNEELLKKEVKIKSNCYRFGFIGGAEQRKNLLKTIEAFYQTFKDNPKVELYIHSSYSAEPEYLEQVKNKVEYYTSKGSNIVFSFGNHLEQDEMYDLIATFNFYIYPSKTTGYFTTPAEALSIGTPVIITDIPVHQELLHNLSDNDGIFRIKATIPEPIQHSYLGMKYLGVQYDCSIDDINKQLISAFNKVDILFTPESIAKRKSRGKLYGLNSVSPLYHAIISPTEFIVSQKSYANKNGTFQCTDFTLSQKYKSIHPYLNICYQDTTPNQINDNLQLKIYDQHNTKIIEKLCIEIEQKKFFGNTPNLPNLTKREKFLNKTMELTFKHNLSYSIKILYRVLKIYAIVKRTFCGKAKK